LSRDDHRRCHGFIACEAEAVTSSVELLLRARVMSDADVALACGHGGPSDADEVERAALVAALLSSSTAADVPSPGASVEELATWMHQ
jgi:hypothetical protein